MLPQHITPKISSLWEVGFTVKAREAFKDGGDVSEAVDILISNAAKRHIVDDSEVVRADGGHRADMGGDESIVQDGGCAAGGSVRGKEGAAETKTDQEASDDAQVFLDIHTFMHNIHMCV